MLDTFDLKCYISNIGEFMKPIALIFAGFFLGLGITYFMQPTNSINYIDQEMHDDKEIDAVIMLEIPQDR